jgi:hypothetical protein
MVAENGEFLQSMYIMNTVTSIKPMIRIICQSCKNVLPRGTTTCSVCTLRRLPLDPILQSVRTFR